MGVLSTLAFAVLAALVRTGLLDNSEVSEVMSGRNKSLGSAQHQQHDQIAEVCLCFCNSELFQGCAKLSLGIRNTRTHSSALTKLHLARNATTWTLTVMHEPADS